MKNLKFYYISKVEHVPDIQENGIHADMESYIPIFSLDKGKINDALNVAGYISSNQLFLDEYALFEITASGITGSISKQSISGKTSQYQKILKQQIIKKEHIKFINIYKTYFAL